MPEVELLLTTQAREPNRGLVVIPDAFTVSHSAEITSLAARFRVPAVYWSRSSAELGGLISYGPYIVDEFRRAASYADRILKGEKPADLPVQVACGTRLWRCFLMSRAIWPSAQLRPLAFRIPRPKRLPKPLPLIPSRRAVSSAHILLVLRRSLPIR
jgi:hypothetical protein